MTYKFIVVFFPIFISIWLFFERCVPLVRRLIGVAFLLSVSISFLIYNVLSGMQFGHEMKTLEINCHDANEMPKGNEKSASGSIGLVAKVDDTKNQLILTVLAKKDICIFKADLPWSNGSPLIILPLEPNGTIHNEEIPIEHHEIENCIPIKKGNSLEGSVNLGDRFPKLIDARHEKEMALFWTYKAAFPLEGSENTRLAGWLLLPKIDESK